MKTLILTDATYAEMERALGESARGRAVLVRFDRGGPELPSDRELVAMARNGDDPPEAITLARAQRDAGIQAATDTRLAMDYLIRHCHGAGVQPGVLMRWFGLSSARTYEIIRSEREESRR